MPEAVTSPYQTNLAGNARKSLRPEVVEYAIDEVNSRRVRLLERLAEIILNPTSEDLQKRSTRCVATHSDHLLIQVLMMQASHCRELSSDEAAAKTAALQALGKTAIEAVKEANSASTELQRIKEHADKMRMEQAKLDQKDARKVPTLQDALAKLAKKTQEEE